MHWQNMHLRNMQQHDMQHGRSARNIYRQEMHSKYASGICIDDMHLLE